MNEVILTVFPNGSALKPSYGLRLPTVTNFTTLDCILLKVILDNETHIIEKSLSTYQNHRRIANPAINDWIFNSNLNGYKPQSPPQLIFSISIQNNEHIYKFRSRVR